MVVSRDRRLAPCRKKSRKEVHCATGKLEGALSCASVAGGSHLRQAGRVQTILTVESVVPVNGYNGIAAPMGKSDRGRNFHEFQHNTNPFERKKPFCLPIICCPYRRQKSDTLIHIVRPHRTVPFSIQVTLTIVRLFFFIVNASTLGLAVLFARTKGAGRHDRLQSEQAVHHSVLYA